MDYLIFILHTYFLYLCNVHRCWTETNVLLGCLLLVLWAVFRKSKIGMSVSWSFIWLRNWGAKQEKPFAQKKGAYFPLLMWYHMHTYACTWMNDLKKKKKAFPEQLSSCQDTFCHKWHPDDEWIIKMWWGTTKNVWLPWNELFPGAFKASAADESHIQWDVIAPGKQHPLDLPYLLLWNSLQFLPINNSGKWLWPLQAANYFSAVSPHH